MNDAAPKGPELPLKPPRIVRAWRVVRAWLHGTWRYFASYFTDQKPTFRIAMRPMLLLVAILYMRLPTTNYIFDEQEALLGNPYVNQLGFKYEDAIYRDFWGLPANASIGSYRPIPNYLWRGLVELGERAQIQVDAHAPIWVKEKIAEKMAPEPVPALTDVARRSWFQHFYNLFFHAMCGAVFTALAWRVTQNKLAAWLTGTTFVTAAILTEAVSGVVGVADVLGGLGALCALAALSMRAHAMPFGVFLALSFGLFSKESAIVCVPLVPLAALLFAPVLHPDKPARLVRAALATIGALAAFVLYVELRKRWFPSPLSAEHGAPLDLDASITKRISHDFFVWFHQAPLPRDSLNNPFVDAPVDLRTAGAMRVYLRGLGQVVFPWTLSGDYSYPQEPVPDLVVFPASVMGWAATVLPLGAAAGLFVVQIKRAWRAPPELPPPPDDEPEPPPPPPRGRISRMTAPARAWIRGTRVAATYLEHQRVIRRFALELGVVVVSTLIVWKVLGIGPSAANEGMGDSDPEKNIVIPAVILRDALVSGALACLFFGSLTEALWRRRSRGEAGVHLPVLALGMVWLVVSYFPHSNIVVLLPTVRAERLWYFPVIGTTMIIATALFASYQALRKTRLRSFAFLVPLLFLGFQGGRAYWHAVDYRSDIDFWRSTKDAVPMSSKAHLNYSVMAGARGDMNTRLFESEIALKLAPDWAMAHIYTGDTLCRMGKPDEAWPHYVTGFHKGPNDKGLISLALQCLWDHQKIHPHEAELRAIEADHPGSWIAFLADDIIRNGDKQGGVQSEHRPRSYNEGPKKEDGTEETATETAEPAASGSGDPVLQAKAPGSEGSAVGPDPSASAAPLE